MILVFPKIDPVGTADPPRMNIDMVLMTVTLRNFMLMDFYLLDCETIWQRTKDVSESL